MRIPGLNVERLGLELPWRATQSEGVYWIPLFLDAWDEPTGDGGESAAEPRAKRGGGTVLIRMDPGCGYPPHRHLGGEDVLVLQGAYTDEYGTHRAGQHVHYAQGTSHAPIAEGRSSGAEELTAENPPCILYATAAGGIELID